MSGWINAGLVGIFFFSIIMGLTKGGIKILSFIIAITAGILIALHNYEGFSLLLKDMIKNPLAARVVAFIVIFILVAVAFGILGSILYKLIHATPLGVLDRLLGFILGGILGFVISFALLTLSIIFYPKTKERIKQSKLATQIIRVGYNFKGVFPKEWQDKVLINP